jgi:hypothetical protein
MSLAGATIIRSRDHDDVIPAFLFLDCCKSTLWKH